MATERRYRLKAGDTPESLARQGKGDARELWQSNRKWMSADFLPWNEGQQVTIPGAWASIDGEFAGES